MSLKDEGGGGFAYEVIQEEGEGQAGSTEDTCEDVEGERDVADYVDMEVRNYFHNHQIYNQENDYEDMTGHSRQHSRQHNSRNPIPGIIQRLEDNETDYFNHVVPVIEETFERYMYDAFLLKQRMLQQIYQHLRHNIIHRQTRSLYCDTDSIVFVSRPGDQYNPLLGNYLGDLTSELDRGDSIKSWNAAGPKSYAYVTGRGKVTLRAKGITQNYENCKKFNFDSLTALVEPYLKDPETRREISARYNTITRNLKTFELTNKERVINFGIVCDKRRLFADGKTLPFGY